MSLFAISSLRPFESIALSRLIYEGLESLFDRIMSKAYTQLTEILSDFLFNEENEFEDEMEEEEGNINYLEEFGEYEDLDEEDEEDEEEFATDDEFESEEAFEEEIGYDDEFEGDEVVDKGDIEATEFEDSGDAITDIVDNDSIEADDYFYGDYEE